MSAPQKTTTLDFTIDPAILGSIIRKQAGTLSKAIMEGVMNSVDAGAPNIAVTVEYDRVTIIDNGKGFQTRDEIEMFFRKFGTPHTDGDAKYGRFRMGRGQLFAFGVNTWRTGPFNMTVDINTRGLNFDLDEGLPHEEGCAVSIKLYAKLSPTELYHLKQSITNELKYVEGILTLNGSQINTPPSSMKWDHETPEAYIKIRPSEGGNLVVYNMGVFTQHIYSNKYGVAGIIVSKDAFDVNMARNEVLSTCPIWKKVLPIIRSYAEKAVKKKLTLSMSEAMALISRIASGEVYAYDYRNVKFIPDSNSRLWSPQGIQSGRFEAFTTATADDSRADKLMQSKQAFVIHAGYLECFACPVSEILERFAARGSNPNPVYVVYDILASQIDNGFHTIDKKNYTPSQHAWVATMREAASLLQRITWQEPHRTTSRQVRVGNSGVAQAWTDGKTYITYETAMFSKNLMQKGQPNVASITANVLVMFHEMCHDTDSRANVHSPEFYQAYHDLTAAYAGYVVGRVCAWLTPERYTKLMKGVEVEDEETVVA